MKKRLLNIVVSLVVAALFIWLAVKSVDLTEVQQELKTVTFYWLPFFICAMIFSHYLRAERWRLLLKSEDQHVPRSTLFAGVMTGYIFNTLVPRLGEISRPVYVAKKQNISSSNLLGTIVVERLFDLATMMVLIFLAAFFLLQNSEVIERVFGIQGWPWYMYLVIPLVFLVIITGIWLFYKILYALDKRDSIRHPFVLKSIQVLKSFGEGMISIKYVKNWPLFLLLTAGIWTGYIIMTYLPFYMLDLPAEFMFTLKEAIVLTMVSSVGVSIPTPAGIGSYHLLIQQSMWMLYDVPLVKGLTYATVAHATTIVLVFIIGPLSLWWDKVHTLRSGDAR